MTANPRAHSCAGPSGDAASVTCVRPLEQVTTSTSVGCGGFATARNKPIVISESAKQRAAKLLREADQSAQSLHESAPTPDTLGEATKRPRCSASEALGDPAEHALGNNCKLNGSQSIDRCK